MSESPVALDCNGARARCSAIAAVELAKRIDRHGALSARMLTRWLLAEQLAVETEDGRLRPTPLALELADWTR